MANSLKLIKHVGISAILCCKTGLKIGGTESDIGIGSAENPVIKDNRGIPYIPGSSLKGKLRSLLEYKYNKIGDNGAPCGCGQPFNVCPVCTVFGPHKNTAHNLGPSRLIVRDAFLTEKSLAEWEKAKNEGIDFTETKTETAIDRRSGMAMRGSLRTQERIVPGTEFKMNLSLRIFEGDDEKKIRDFILEGLKLLSNDYLGGSGTRGYGWLEIKNIEVKDL